jgi:Protein of unknown function (DUF4058)
MVVDGEKDLMPLLDHFHAPLFPSRPWESFPSRWANSIADALNRLLPRRSTAEVQLHPDSQVEADVAEFERAPEPDEESSNGAGGGLAVQTWAPPTAVLVMPAECPDDLEVQVLDQRDDAQVVAVVELISPRNKDRAEARRAFAAKCAAYLQRGIGLVVVDIITSRQFNLHNELVQLLDVSDAFAMAAEASLYAVAYRPARRQSSNPIDLWPVALTVGGVLPVLPLALRGTRAVPLDLEAAYTDARQRSRL